MEPWLLDELNRNKASYWRTMNLVRQPLNRWLTIYCRCHREFMPIVGRYTDKKAHFNGIQFYAGYLAGGGDPNRWEQFIPVMIALELIMIWAYALNQIVDRKRRVWEKPGGVELTALEHNLVLALLLDLLEESRMVLGSSRYPITQAYVMRMLANMGKGFWIERQCLNVNVTPLEQILPNWRRNYDRRNRLIDQVYDYTPLVGYYVATGDSSVFERFESFFAERLAFSEAAQILNDFSDFLVGSCDVNVKSYQDAFADLRNGYITYPVYQLLDSEEVKEALENPSLTLDPSWQRRMDDVRRASKLTEEIRGICWAAWDDHIQFWQGLLGGHSLLLLGTYSLLGFNKYFKQAEE